MKEKEVAKIKLSTCFLIFSVLVILLMGIFMYKLYNEKEEETKKASELQTQVDNLNSTITELQGKINNMLETANSNEKIEHETSKTDSSKTNSDALYVYSSGDRNAAKGNPELLYVYEFSNDKMKFKYHAI